MESQVFKIVKRIIIGVSKAETKQAIVQWCNVISGLLSSSNSDSEQHNKDYFYCLECDAIELSSLQKTVASSSALRVQLYELYIQQFSVDWMSAITTENYHKIVKKAFLEGPAADAFLSVLQAITESTTKDFRFHTCVSLLEEMLTIDRLYQIMREQCLITPDVVSNKYPGIDSIDSEQLCTALTSLPEKLANRLLHDNSEKFYPGHYFPLLSMAVLRTLEQSHHDLTKCQDVSLQMVSSLVGKLCLCGAADMFLDTVLPHLCAKVRVDFAWSRICVRVFTGVPARYLEAVLVQLLKKIPWYGLVERLIGDCVIDNTTAKMLICTKLLLYKSFSDAKLLLQNIVGYLSQSPNRRHLYLEVFLNLLEVWGSNTSMRYISAEQHLYISKALMVCVGVLKETDIAAKKDAFLQRLMPGVQAHLGSSDPKVRLVGMTVAKRLTHKLDPSGPQLEFDLDTNNDVIRDLLRYEELPEDSGPTQAEVDASSHVKELETKLSDVRLGSSATQRADLQEDLDSDDDLIPYDMSNDEKIASVKPPKYLRECMEGLICTTDNLDKAELCLKHADSIIRKKTDGLEEIAAEFTKILLHMTDSHGMDDFFKNRRKALVALAVTSPKEVSDYLTSQFYERNYNLRQRMDMLEILAEAAGELSQPEKMTLPQNPREKKIVELSPNSEPASWKEVVQRRIESNTRRFAKGRTRPELAPQLNRFAPVAGHFFYPLLVKVDKQEPCLDLLGQDSALLFRLIYTLAIVIHAATHLPAVTQMGHTLLEFIWSLRMHPDQSVRQAVLIATTTVFLSVPAHCIMTNLHTDIAETLAWLEEVVERDADTECQKLAAQAMLILQEQIKKVCVDLTIYK